MLKKIFGKLFKSVDDRAAEDEEYFKRTSNKYNKPDEKPKFKEDYFKGTGEETARRLRQRAAEKKNNRRTTTTSEGVTIIDDRDKDKVKRKIFTKDEGEYVDFSENR